MASCLSQATAGDEQADEFWHLHHSECTNTLNYAHTNLRILPTCHESLGLLTLPAREDGDFAELVMLYRIPTSRLITVKTKLFLCKL